MQLDDPWAIRQQALGLNSVFTRIHSRAVAVQGIWQGPGPHYVAPEQGLMLAAMTTPVNEAETLSDESVRVRTAWTPSPTGWRRCAGDGPSSPPRSGSSTRTRPGSTRRTRGTTWATDIWDAITGEAERLYHRETALNEQIAALQADKDAAERECANAIGDIWRAPRYSAAGETWVTDEYVYGMNATGYVALSEAGDAPWGVATMWSSPNLLVKTTMVLEGADEAVAGSLDFVVSLTGLNGADQAKAAYSGTGMLLWNDFVATAPVAYLFTSAEERAAARSSLVEVGEGMIGWDTWDTTGYKTAGGLGLDVLLTVGTGGLRSGREARSGPPAPPPGSAAPPAWPLSSPAAPGSTCAGWRPPPRSGSTRGWLGSRPASGAWPTGPPQRWTTSPPPWAVRGSPWPPPGAASWPPGAVARASRPCTTRLVPPGTRP